MKYVQFDANDLALLKKFNFRFEAGPTGEPTTDMNLLICRDLLRAREYDGRPTVLAQGGGDAALHAVVDAVHWHLHAPDLDDGRSQLRVAVRTGPEGTPHLVPNATVAALAAIADEVGVELVRFELDALGLRFVARGTFSPVASDSRVTTTWRHGLQARKKPRPTVVAALDELLADTVPVPVFGWYRSLTGKEWSGRVAGWQVCTALDWDPNIHWQTKSAEPVLAMQPGPALVAKIVQFATERGQSTHKHGSTKLEHMLESAVLRHRVGIPLGSDRLAAIVQAPEPPFQFPALYAHDDDDGQARYVDALMHHNDAVWVVELKVATGGQGEYYRHALTQALLYRRFIRTAVPLHAAIQGLNPALPQLLPQWCQAAIAFPKLTSKRQNLLPMLKQTALQFRVHVIELEQDIAEIRHLATTSATTGR